MTRRTQTLLYHLLPIVFWLLAIGGNVVPVVLSAVYDTYALPDRYYFGYLVAALALLSIFVIRRIPRHTEAVEQCFQVALLLGIASYWLPSVVFLLVPIWGYLIYQNLLDTRSFIASLLGLAVVAVWIAVLHRFSLADYHFSPAYNVWAWISTGSVLLAWLGTTIVRQILRVR